MIACDNDDCPYEWFHVSCVGLDSIPQGEWHCKDCYQSMTKNEMLSSQIQKLQCMMLVQYNKLGMKSFAE